MVGAVARTAAVVALSLPRQRRAAGLPERCLFAPLLGFLPLLDVWHHGPTASSFEKV
jgi:hypothetical protein